MPGICKIVSTLCLSDWKNKDCSLKQTLIVDSSNSLLACCITTQVLRGHSVCPLPMPLWYGQLVLGRWSRRRRILAMIYFKDPNGHDISVPSKLTDRWKFRILCITDRASIWGGFRKKYRKKKWKRAGGQNTEKLGIRFRYHTRTNGHHQTVNK